MSIRRAIAQAAWKVERAMLGPNDQTKMIYDLSHEASESGREYGRLVVAKYDEDATEWASRRMGGEALGRKGFRQPSLLDFERFHIRPFEEVVSACNLITTAGWNRAIYLIAGLQTTGSYIGTACRIGVGTGTTAADKANTDLAAGTGTAGRWFNLVTGNGVTSAGTATERLSFTATFGTGDANFPNPWQEWGLDQATTGSGTGAATAVFFNRAVSNLGTKSGGTWTATANFDFA